MGEPISDQELRRRLLAFNTVVPPVTVSTRKLLLKKLAKLESNSTQKESVSKSMPPPKAPTNGTNESVMISSSMDIRKPSQHIVFDHIDSPRKSTRFRRIALDTYDTSDSEVDTGSLGHSIQPANPYIVSSSPKSNETSLMNVSNWKNTNNADEDQNSYYSHEEKQKTEKITTKRFNSKVNSTPTEPVTKKQHSSPVTKTSNADLAIQRWKEKMMNQPQDKFDETNASLFNSPSPIPKTYKQNSRKIIQPLQRYTGIKYINNIKNSQNIILLFVGFFIVIFGLYFISLHPSTTILPSGILNSWCAKKNIQESKCDVEQEKVQHLYNSLVAQVQDKYIKNQCDKSNIEPTVDALTVFEYISTHENIPAREIEELVELFKSIAKTYSDSPIGFDTSFNINVQPNLPIMCAVKLMFSNMFYLITWISIVALSVLGLYFVICYITTNNENYKQEVNKLVENTIILLKEQAQNQPNESYIPIIHIRDNLIPFNERQAKTKIWAEVVQYFTESESSVRSEVKEIDGEDFQVWRWVQPMSPSI